jgi:hypothetical protein
MRQILGEGGFGSVFQATYRGTLVAVKRAAINPETRSKFLK